MCYVTLNNFFFKLCLFLVVPVKRKYSNATLPCIFCRVVSSVVENPKPETYNTVQRIMKRMQSAKHIALAQIMYHLTRSNHIINILTKLG